MQIVFSFPLGQIDKTTLCVNAPMQIEAIEVPEDMVD